MLGGQSDGARLTLVVGGAGVADQHGGTVAVSLPSAGSSAGGSYGTPDVELGWGVASRLGMPGEG